MRRFVTDGPGRCAAVRRRDTGRHRRPFSRRVGVRVRRRLLHDGGDAADHVLAVTRSHRDPSAGRRHGCGRTVLGGDTGTAACRSGRRLSQRYRQRDRLRAQGRDA